MAGLGACAPGGRISHDGARVHLVFRLGAFGRDRHGNLPLPTLGVANTHFCSMFHGVIDLDPTAREKIFKARAQTGDQPRNDRRTDGNYRGRDRQRQESRRGESQRHYLERALRKRGDNSQRYARASAEH